MSGQLRFTAVQHTLMRPQREARGHRAVRRIHQTGGSLHGHILRAGVQGSPTARKGTSLSGLLSDNTADRIPQVIGELRGVRDLVVGIVVGCADAGEGASTEHPEARQTVEEILIRAGNRSLAVAQRVSLFAIVLRVEFGGARG